jgi:hypothetical protein
VRSVGSVRSAALTTPAGETQKRVAGKGRRIDRKALRHFQPVGCVTRKWVKRFFD